MTQAVIQEAIPVPPLRRAVGRLDDLDRAKGVAIILVVLGHIVAKEPPAENQWYPVLKEAIYCFHMPFFMYLSGVAFFVAGYDRLPLKSLPQFVGNRAERLLVPFVLFGVLIVVGKFVAARVLHVDDPPADLLTGLSMLVWWTGSSPALSIWYLFVLFVFSAAIIPLLHATGGRLWPWLVIGTALHFIPVPKILYADRIVFFFVFFVIGGLVARSIETSMTLLDRYWVLWVALFAASFGLLLLDAPRWACFAVIGVLSIPAIHGLVRQPPLSRSLALLWLGGYAFTIYLFNTILIGLTKAVILKFASWNGPNFLLIAPILVSAGLFAPIILKQVLKRNPVLDRLTG